MFATLPTRGTHWRCFAVSFTTQGLTLLMVLLGGIFFPDTIGIWNRPFATLVVPPPPVNQAPQPLAARLQVRPEPEIVHSPNPEHILRVPKIEPPRIAAIEVPKLPPLLSVTDHGGRLTPPIQTNVFSSGSSAPQTVNLPAKQVQTGGFGDPNGVPANAQSSGSPNIAAVGSFDLPSGEGYGNGTGGSKGVRGVVASAGFGNGIAAAGDGSGGRGRGTVQQAGFADASKPVPATSKPLEPPPAPVTTAVEVLWKPKPAYTEEARQLRIEGEVVLQVTFTADGHVRVLQVVRGLGHGLDESAAQAARQIRFKPAQRDGRSVDSTAIIHIVFQVA